MAGELGKIERLEADKFKEGRKLLLVPSLYVAADAPEDIKKKCEQYWSEADQAVKNLTARLGKVTCVYYESVFTEGEEGMKIIEKINLPAHRIAASLVDGGARLMATEDRATSEEAFDWERCLAMGLVSTEVRTKVYGFWAEAVRKRYAYISKRINETLGKEETGVLFIQEENWVQFPSDVQVFNVYPPSLDEIHRLARDAEEKARKSGDEGDQKS